MLAKIIAVGTALTFLVLMIASFIDMELFREMWVKAFEAAVLLGLLYIVVSIFTRK
ncbi:hypothetical protein ES703_35414 [subsurface metagenome]